MIIKCQAHMGLLQHIGLIITTIITLHHLMGILQLLRHQQGLPVLEVQLAVKDQQAQKGHFQIHLQCRLLPLLLRHGLSSKTLYKPSATTQLHLCCNITSH